MSASVRKRLLAALDAAHGILNESDEFEAENATVKSALEATKAELKDERSRLASVKATVAGAETNHEKWLRATEAERQRITAEINGLSERLRELESLVAERQAEFENILAGIQALTARLKV